MDASGVEVTKCGGCKRRLTSARSIARGRGPVCARRLAEATRAAALTEKPAQVAKAASVIATGGVVHRTRHLWLVASSDGRARYDVDTAAGSCTCTAGRYGRRCYHLLGAEITEAA